MELIFFMNHFAHWQTTLKWNVVHQVVVDKVSSTSRVILFSELILGANMIDGVLLIDFPGRRMRKQSE